MDTTTGLRLANTSPDVAAFRSENAKTSGDPTGPANSLGTPLNNVEHFRHHRSSDEKLSPEKREAALVQITGVRPVRPVRMAGLELTALCARGMRSAF